MMLSHAVFVLYATCSIWYINMLIKLVFCINDLQLVDKRCFSFFFFFVDVFFYDTNIYILSFSLTDLINSVIHEHSYKILCVVLLFRVCWANVGTPLF